MALAALAVLPLLVTGLWSGWRLALADPTLGVIAPTEQPLSVRSIGGVWAVGLALGWFCLAYWRRQCSSWEVGLVLIGGGAALARLGNTWLDALAMLLPLSHQLSGFRCSRALYAGAALLGLAGLVATFAVSRPPTLPDAARNAASSAASSGVVFADWRWAPELQRQLGPDRTVIASAGFASESGDFWLDYLRVSEGHERWADLLHRWNADVMVLDSADQQWQLAELVRTSNQWRVIYDANGSLVARRLNS